MTATSDRKCYERYGRFSPIGLLVKTLLESSQWYNPAVKLRWDVKNLCSERLTEKEYCIGRNTLSKQCVTTLNVKDISFSGGKDSLASLLWVRNNLTKDFITVFCDTGWEHPLTYKYIEEVQEQLGLNLITVKSKKFNGMVDLTKKKSRWPSSQRRFCTSELKTIPMIDYILDEVNDDVLIIQGIRAAESAKRAEMSKQCTYFKYYVQPYGKDKNGKDKYHTYRRKDVLAFRKKYADDLLRPVFDWSAQQVIDYILENGIQPNPLYRMGYKRVGCFPCVMASQQDIYNISVQEPERISYIAGLEQQFNSSFFGPDKISSKYYKGEYPLISDVVRYVQSKRAGGSLFDDDVATSCMSYYGLCE